ncbi:MAG TPA: DUF2252 family protein [Tepidisphaeraceae bacterium]|jgi:uncharacterized protein (DUF2252 family)
MRISAIAFVTCLAAATFARGQVFDRITEAYRPYLDAHDPLSLDLKLKSLSSSPYTFWRGSKDLFYTWAKTECADWLSERDQRVTIHGDLHLGNIGTYATDFQQLAFGLVDFDDSTTLPFQIELLQGMISLDLAREQNKLDLTDEQRREIDDALLTAYRRGLTSGQNATEVLAGEPMVAKLLAKTKKPYDSEIKQYVADDRFKPFVGKAEKPKEILRPLDEATLDAFAAGLAAAAGGDAALAARLKVHDATALRQSIIAGASRTRLGSSGSQGQRKYLFLLRGALADQPGDVLLYLKEQIPTSAQRAGVAPPDDASPSERWVRDATRLTAPPMFLCAAVTVSGRSFAMTLKEPWSDELSSDDAVDFESLKALAGVWGTVAGRAHGKGVDPAKLTPALAADLRQRADAYVARQAADFAAFVADERVKAAAQRVSDAVQAATRSQSNAQ